MVQCGRDINKGLGIKMVEMIEQGTDEEARSRVNSGHYLTKMRERGIYGVFKYAVPFLFERLRETESRLNKK